MSNLLQVMRLRSPSLQNKNNVPLMVEFQVEPDAKPFLVSSTAGLLWLENSHPGDVIKAAVRKDVTPEQLFKEVMFSLIDRGQKDSWGNKFPFTKEGLYGAIEYVKSYDLNDLEILIPCVKEIEEGMKKKPQGKKYYKRPEWLHPKEFKVPFRPSSWMPDDCAIVVPRDREYFGLLGHLTAKAVVVAVHNASRGFAIACK